MLRSCLTGRATHSCSLTGRCRRHLLTAKAGPTCKCVCLCEGSSCYSNSKVEGLTCESVLCMMCVVSSHACYVLCAGRNMGKCPLLISVAATNSLWNNQCPSCPPVLTVFMLPCPVPPTSAAATPQPPLLQPPPSTTTQAVRASALCMPAVASASSSRVWL